MCISGRPTFRQIYQKKSTRGYKSLPYVVALFSAMLWMYYAFIAKDTTLISINSVGCVTETLYIIIYLIYGTKEARKSAAKQIVYLNVSFFGFILLFTFFQFHGALRLKIVGWICVAIATCVFAAPLSVVVQVLRTRSVEFMPLPLSFFLTLSAVIWFAYGLFKGDMNVALPNVLGFILGVLQMLLYAIYKSTPKKVLDGEKLPQHIINMITISGPEVYPVDPNTSETKNEDNKDETENKEEIENDKNISYDEKCVGQTIVDLTQTTFQIIPNPPVIVVCAG